MRKLSLSRNLTALLLAGCTLLSCTSCGGGAKAATMRLRKTEGTVEVSDDGGKDVEPKENLGLYSGYGVDTRNESYAWIDLDKVKLTKLDQDSEIEITRDGKDLEIEVKSGSLFFNVAKPLEDDETMEIRTSSMLVGIRGTCGWVTQDAAALLEGTVTITAGEETATVNAGEMAKMSIVDGQGSIKVSALQERDIPAFVADELPDQLVAEAAQSMAEAQERYPLSGFRALPSYIDESELPAQTKDILSKTLDAAKAENWDEVRSLAFSTLELPDHSWTKHEFNANASVRNFYTEYMGYRIYVSNAIEDGDFDHDGTHDHSESAIVEFRPESGLGFYTYNRDGFQNGHTIGSDIYVAGQCENYVWHGSYTRWSISGIHGDGTRVTEPWIYTGQAINGLLDGEILNIQPDGYVDRQIYDMGIQVGTGNAFKHTPTGEEAYSMNGEPNPYFFWSD